MGTLGPAFCMWTTSKLYLISVFPIACGFASPCHLNIIHRSVTACPGSATHTIAMRPTVTSHMNSCQGALRLLCRRQTRHYATRLRQSSRSQIPNLRPRQSHLPRRQDQHEPGPAEPGGPQVAQAVPSIEEILKNEDSSTNPLLAPVHIPEDPNAVLKERHPATSILANSGLVIQRQIEMMNLFLGFEQANRYVILDAQGNHTGYMAEHDGGIGKSLARQTFRTHRPFTAHIFDRTGKEVLRVG